MKIQRILVLFLLILAGAAQDVFAQDYPPVPVTISRSLVAIDGKTYYVHIVLERQTIYGITQAYKVTEKDLYDANPLLAREGLKAGSVIYIPVTSEQKEETPAKPVPEKKQPDADGFIEHTVKWFEDIYDVAKTYGVTAEEIMAANGLRSSRISKRQTLRIPVTDQAKKSLQDKLPSVKKPVEEKPAVTEPVQEVPVQVESPAEEQPAPVETLPEKATVSEPENGNLDWLTGAAGNGKAELALILPFNATGRTSETNMDFYSGVLIALRDLEKEGVKATLNVFDLQAGVPASYDLGKNDFILGPITGSDLTTILGVTGGRIPVISPLDQRAADLSETHEGFIQAPSSVISQYTELARWAAEERAREDKIILVTEKTNNGTTAAATGVRSALMAAGTEFDSVSWTQGEGRSLPTSLSSRLTKNGVNRVIVASETEAFVGDLVRNLGILLGRGYEIILYAPSRIRTFETIDSSSYHQCSLHICSPYFADYEADNVTEFVRSYRALFRTEPSQFAFQGYDLTRYFVGLVAKYGNHWTRALGHVDGSGIHTDFRFEPARTGSFRNTAIRRIIYHPDYSTKLVR